MQYYPNTHHFATDDWLSCLSVSQQPANPSVHLSWCWTSCRTNDHIFL